MNIFTRLKNTFSKEGRGTGFKLITDRGNSVYSWDGQLFQSDLVRSCIRPFAVACGKAVPKHLRGHGDELKTNPEPYMRFLLEEPNPWMSMQQLLEKLARQRELNNNAFALIVRDAEGYPIGIYPINAVSALAKYDDAGNLYIEFMMLNGKRFAFSYENIIHLRQDFNDNDIFGTPPGQSLAELMTLIGTVDNSIISAVKNSSVIRWLLTYQVPLKPEDLEKNAKIFADSFLKTTSDGTGVAATDSKATATQINPTDYVPNKGMADSAVSRLYAYFSTNDKIVHSAYTEDEWNAYYEQKIEPFLIDFSNECTRKLFTRKERGFENRIFCESSNLAYASMKTKLSLSGMVDRGAMTPNEWREVMNMASLPGGDEPIRRLDTAAIGEPATNTDDEGGENDEG